MKILFDIFDTDKTALDVAEIHTISRCGVEGFIEDLASFDFSVGSELNSVLISNFFIYFLFLSI